LTDIWCHVIFLIYKLYQFRGGLLAEYLSTTAGIKAALVGLAAFEIPTEKLLNQINISRKIIDEQESQLPTRKVDEFWELVAQFSNTTLLPLKMSNFIPFGTYKTVDYLLSFSTTLHEGLNKFIDFYPLVHHKMTWTLCIDGDETTLELSHPLSGRSDYHEIFELGILWNRIKRVTQEKAELSCLYINEIFFSHKEELFEFFEAKINFTNGNSAIVIKTRSLSLPLKNSDSHLADLLTVQAKEQLKNLQLQAEEFDISGDHFIHKLSQDILIRLRGQNAHIQTLAKDYGMSTRTLQRRLKDLGHSFSDVIKKVRITRAKELLASPDMSLSEIAFALGFSETSAFHRAFKKWIGITPMEYRKQVGKSK
jgi:AraC-like DNA-binding protein